MLSKPLFNLDTLPGYSDIQAELAVDDNNEITKVRFRATNDRNEVSQWSGWFQYEGEPIPLTWSTFWIGEDNQGK